MTLIGDNRLIEQIGAGGMGEVWVEKNVHHKKRYALKLQSEELARVMSELDHPGLVRVDHREIPQSGTTWRWTSCRGWRATPSALCYRMAKGRREVAKWQRPRGPEGQREPQMNSDEHGQNSNEDIREGTKGQRS